MKRVWYERVPAPQRTRHLVAPWFRLVDEEGEPVPAGTFRTIIDVHHACRDRGWTLIGLHHRTVIKRSN